MDKKNQKMENSEFHKFFIDELKDIYWAEQHLLEALPKLQKASTSKQLAMAFEKHAKETQKQIKKVEQVFEILGEKAEPKKCEAMEGLLKEADSIIEDTDKDTFTRDAGLILAAQKAEHYEIATYGTLRIFARHMGHEEVEKLLEEILQNEKGTDAYLTKIAEDSVNERAMKE
ncbi:ferritin-like domain-containing protein [Dysgonomonas sp. Marseille-P4677]|uniref:YciE/YciF ferroxidase family protein n=1 Tax=Dysgonomonas sp. Marseille-P4677 TaxID=2364790 RepID=UPI001F387DF3|nr:ferritin-like domain-containing protein [Dysgonomonas sp. Marseille-P4677]